MIPKGISLSKEVHVYLTASRQENYFTFNSHQNNLVVWARSVKYPIASAFGIYFENRDRYVKLFIIKVVELEKHRKILF